LPPYLRKSSAFPADDLPEFSGSAAGGEAAEISEDAPVKQSCSANRQAEPESYIGIRSGEAKLHRK